MDVGVYCMTGSWVRYMTEELQNTIDSYVLDPSGKVYYKTLVESSRAKAVM